MGMQFRVEKDFLGEKQLPAEAYYGINTVRAVENFPISGVPIHAELISALGEVKKAAALANMELGLLPKKIGQAIVEAADEIIAGSLRSEFIVDSIQGGAGTSINMNMNEVLANRALELLGKQKAEYFYCNPNNHVNMSQSTNDAIPTAIRIASYRLAQELLAVFRTLVDGIRAKAREFDDVIKMGRTHLQDAVPIRMGQEFGAYANVLSRDIARIDRAAQGLLVVNMGATAVGTGLNATPAYMDSVVKHLVEQTGFALKQAEDLVDATQNTDAYMELSAALKVCAVNISKMCNDIRLMASGPKAGLNELNVPARQPGSSIMPGKVNPVMAEVMNQIAFQVIGNDHTISLACEAGQFELNVMVPVAANNLMHSLKILRNGMDVFYKNLVVDLQANKERCKHFVDTSYGIITALNPHLGYDVASRLVKEAQKTGQSIREIILEQGLLTEEQVEVILDPYHMTSPGIAGEEFLLNQ
ncbi:aspartate ammonia-lyase [Paenibacillus ihbetae]|uniref:Aspartate ammonia-lyase n=1 Tax=Paenibacillus ihbetae TaxID=1870820 RepID=A0A1B2DZX2_9BACL|nr:aspartate ammonia-lyase [Paenibacillus ihbetae]ANY73275.1 aspartate ammonia-lyase [Paenibacillus ihbetae]OOC59201.1 aspartate ammonia-lyase [Paenibacillus ihbetae]